MRFSLTVPNNFSGPTQIPPEGDANDNERHRKKIVFNISVSASKK